MARTLSQISDVQKDTALFDTLKEKAQSFGYERIAEAANLKTYQSVMKYFNGSPVMKHTEEKILKGIHSLTISPSPAYLLAQTIVN